MAISIDLCTESHDLPQSLFDCEWFGLGFGGRQSRTHCTGCSWRLQRGCVGRIAIGLKVRIRWNLQGSIIILNRNSTNLVASCTSVWKKSGRSIENLTYKAFCGQPENLYKWKCKPSANCACAILLIGGLDPGLPLAARGEYDTG